MITNATLDEAVKIKGMLAGSFVSGSFITNEFAANDLDLVVSESVWVKASDEITNKFPGTVQSSEQVDRYNDNSGEREEEFYEVYGIYYTEKNVNIVVVKDYMYSAYYAAMMELKRHPDMYQTREQRVAMHKRFKDIVKEMLRGQQLAEATEKPADVRSSEGPIFY